MRAVVQRVSSASVSIAGTITGAIGPGLLVLLGIAPTDNDDDIRWLAEKLVRLRLFPDDAGLMNRSLQDIAGGLLVVSQFTLFASTRKGTRPSFNDAARPEIARPLYARFLAEASAALGRPVEAGRFGEMMQVALINDGPVTLVIDTRERS
jgi:D-tyrosyl-tRNA(Tyr) deacylase